MTLHRCETEVLVVGSGAAGLRAALAAAELGAAVIVVNKGPVAKSGITLTAAGGIQAPFHPDDSAQQYLQDTIRCGYGMGDQNLAWVLATEACDAVKELERYGARFVRNATGEYTLGRFPGQTQPRNLFVKGGGVGIVAALSNACKAHEKIKVMDDFFVTGLVQGKSTGKPLVAGVMGLDLRSGELTLIRARSVVLATGGCQWLWEVNDCPSDATGEGLAYAFRAGAELIDMEMVLFYPSVIVWPPSLKGAFVHYEFLAEDILDGNIYDSKDRAILPKPLPVRDQAMRLMDLAIREGHGGTHNGLIWYVGDSAKGGATVRKKLDIAQYNFIKSHGVDPATAKIEVAPGAHYLMGGIYINEECRTTIDGLFATPECAGNFDGANRLAGSGLAATQVFGARAGRYANNWALLSPLVEVDAASVAEEEARVARRVLGTVTAGTSSLATDIKSMRDRLRAAVQQHAGVRRDQAGLSLLAQEARAIKTELAGKQVPARKTYNQALMDVLQLESMCDIASLVAGSALLRTESRGHHFRTDFPAQDDESWLRHTCAVGSGDEQTFETRPLKVI